MADYRLYPAVTVTPETPLQDVLRLMNSVQLACQFLPDTTPPSSLPWRSPEGRPSCVLVMAETRLVGIVTSSNVIQTVAIAATVPQICAGDMMTSPVITLPQSSLGDGEAIGHYFQAYGIHHLPVIDPQGQPIGLITAEQFLKHQLHIQLQDEITRHHQTEEALKQRIRLEELVTTISAQFIPLEARQIDDGIRRALQAIAEFTGADRSYLFRITDDGQVANTHEWCAPTVPSLQTHYNWQPLEMEQRQALRTFRSFAVPSLPATPTRDRLLHRRPQIQAAIQVPIILEQSLVGMIGLDVERSPRPWGQDTVMLLTLVGEIVAGALKRQHTEIILNQSMATNRALLEALPDAILRITRDGILVNKKPDAHGIIPVPDDNFLGKHLSDVFPPDIARMALTCVHQALETRAIQSFEYKLQLGGTVYDYEARFAVSDRHEVMVILRDISDRKRAEAELQRAKDQLRAVLDAVPGLISWIREDLVYQGVNTRMAAAFGRSPEEFSGQSIGFLGGRLEFNTFVEEFFASHEQTATRETRLDINGQEYDYLVVAQKYAHNQAAVFVGIDITERQRAERQLYESQQLLQLVVDNIPEAIFWKDRNSVYLGCNQTFANVVGLASPADLGTGKTDFDLFPWAADAADYYRRHDRQVMEADCPEYHVIETQIQADGHQYWIDKNLIPLHNSDRQVVGILGTCEDITARRDADQKLRQSEERYRALAKNFPNGAVLLFDLNLRYTLADGMGLEKMNLSKASVEGKTLWDVFPAAIAEQVEPHYRQALAGEASSLELSLGDRIYLMQVTPLNDRQGDCFAGMATTQDVTKYKHVEQEIRNALEKEKQLNELKSRFISMASHEFRTPLATILGSSEILRHFGTKCSEEKRVKHYQRIQTGVEQMTRLLDDVLLIGRAEAGRVPFQPVPIDIVPFCENLQEELQISSADKRNVVIHTHVRPDRLPSPTYLEADEQLLRQILTNLLSNAIKYSHPGSCVDFSIMIEEQSVQFCITDHGIGIPTADQGRLFEQFHRAGNVGTTQGTGLGLSIVKKSVELHGGTITLVSDVNQGTTCTVVLPRTQATQPASP
jgi:PAS domain S-box-containing protein